MGIQARGILREAMGLHGASAAGAGMASLWSCMEDSHVNSKCQSHLPPNALERARGVALSLRCHLQSLTSLLWASGCCPGAFQKRPLSPSSSLTPHPTLPEPQATASPNGLCGEAAAGASVPPACLPGLLPWPEHFRGSLGLCRMKTHTLDLGGDSWDAQEGDSRDGHPGWARRPARPWACSSAPPPGTSSSVQCQRPEGDSRVAAALEGRGLGEGGAAGLTACAAVRGVQRLRGESVPRLRVGSREGRTGARWRRPGLGSWIVAQLEGR